MENARFRATYRGKEYCKTIKYIVSQIMINRASPMEALFLTFLSHIFNKLAECSISFRSLRYARLMVVV